jgi:hypothetical protein
MNFMKAEEAAWIIVSATKKACEDINTFSQKVLRTRGGRIGSGMGTLIEALWGYYVNQVLQHENTSLEIAWLSDHEYNDFACIQRDQKWETASKIGELFRVEAKSMNADAEESKGHFDELIANLNEWDLLLVIVWSWDFVDEYRVYPHIKDHFVGRAQSIAKLRDELHIARGGSFVNREKCPDECTPALCSHHGEPLNAHGKRERLSGPESTRPSNVSYAANFGGLVRMLKTGSDEARHVLRRIRAIDPTAHNYISFIHRTFPDEERNQYLTTEWKRIAHKFDISTSGLSRDQVIAQIRLLEGYQEHLRDILVPDS